MENHEDLYALFSFTFKSIVGYTRVVDEGTTQAQVTGPILCAFTTLISGLHETRRVKKYHLTNFSDHWRNFWTSGCCWSSHGFYLSISVGSSWRPVVSEGEQPWSNQNTTSTHDLDSQYLERRKRVIWLHNTLTRVAVLAQNGHSENFKCQLPVYVVGFRRISFEPPTHPPKRICILRRSQGKCITHATTCLFLHNASLAKDD